MAQPLLLPAGAPFGADQISALNSVFSASTAEQRTWLSGFLAGVQAANAPAQATPAAPPKARAPLTILFGTESGNAEALAARARKAAAKLGFAVKLVDILGQLRSIAAAEGVEGRAWARNGTTRKIPLPTLRRAPWTTSMTISGRI